MQLMPDDMFNRLVSDLGRFPAPVKAITFARLGEPLLNRRLPEMIECLKKKKLCEKTLVISNGIPLTQQMSLDLVCAGLDRIKLSISGLSSDDYQKNCGTRIDFDKLVSEICFLYNNRGNMKVQVKILDKLLGDDTERGTDRFHSIFGDICDEIDVEHLFPMFKNDLDYSGLFFKDSIPPVNRYGICENRKVCSTPFYKLSIAADGSVEYCFSRGISAGNLLESSLYDIWHGEKRKEVLLNLLRRKHEGVTEPCLSCGCSQDTTAGEDNLDPYADKLILKVDSYAR